MILKAAIALLVLTACATTTTSKDAPSASEVIPRMTQELMDALPHDKSVWERYMSDRGVYVGEGGEVATKAELLEGFMPFPPGLSGSIQVVPQRLIEHGDVAVFVYDGREKQTVYDQNIEVNYRSTHTWRRENGQWKLIAAQNLVLARDPKPTPINVSRLGDYEGTYDLSGKRRYRVERRGDALFGGREGGQLALLIPVGDNVFVDSGSNLGILRIFVRGADGTVKRMVQRRKFADTDWVKLAP